MPRPHIELLAPARDTAVGIERLARALDLHLTRAIGAQVQAATLELWIHGALCVACRPREMHVVGAMRRHAHRQMQAQPVTFYGTRSPA